VFADALDIKAAADRIGVSPATVAEMVHNRELVAVRLGGAWRFPAWQFSTGGVLPGVRGVLEEWPGSTVSLSVWACSPSQELYGRTPAQALEDRLDH
jgi:excisionase family DNA binding protein